MKRSSDTSERIEVSILLTIPCGDFYWMKMVDLKEVKYIGEDVVKELINLNEKNLAAKKEILYN